MEMTEKVNRCCENKGLVKHLVRIRDPGRETNQERTWNSFENWNS